MAGTRITQQAPYAGPGRRYGDFSGRPPFTPPVSAIGVVPVRYLVGQTANVVPVETVLVAGIGVVSVREFVGPANVVPVREAPTETPRVKVRKV